MRYNKIFLVTAVLAALGATTTARGDILGWWSFEDGGGETVADVSGNDNHGVPSDNFAFGTDAARGGVGDFGDFGNNAFVSIPSAADGAFNSIVDTQQATISFWMNRQGKDPNSQWTFIFDGGSDSSDRVTGRQLASHAGWGGGNGTLYFDTGGCCNADQRINKEMLLNDVAFGQDGEWHHLAYVRDVDDTYVYVDGQLFHNSAPDVVTSPVAPMTQATIGANAVGGGSQAGLIDDFAIWNEALSLDRIQALAAGAPPVGENGPDFNLDNVVDTLDYDILRSNYGERFAFGESADKGDQNGDLKVDMTDFFAFRASFLAAQAGGASAVPEPSAGILFSVAAIALGFIRKRR